MFSALTGKFVQVLQENNHWVAVFSPTERAISVVYLYDLSQKENLNKNIVKQITKAAQQQQNGYDWGIFETVFATSLAYNKKQKTYNQGVMRNHLLGELKNETKTLFPQQVERVKRKKEVTHCFPLNSKCHVPFFEYDHKEGKWLFMAFWSVCGESYYKRCENTPVVIFRHKKMLLYGNAQTINKSRKMPSSFF